MAACQDLDGEERGIFGTPDRDGCDGYAPRHLDDGEERVESSKGFGWNRNADHREMSLCGQHAG